MRWNGSDQEQKAAHAIRENSYAHTDHPTIPIDFEAGFSYFDCSYFDRIIIWGHLLEIVVGTPQRRCAGRFHMLKSRLGILPVVDLSVEAKVLAPFDSLRTSARRFSIHG